MNGGILAAKAEHDDKSGHDHHDIPTLLSWDVQDVEG